MSSTAKQAIFGIVGGLIAYMLIGKIKNRKKNPGQISRALGIPTVQNSPTTTMRDCE